MYLSYNNNFLQPGSSIFITDIGTLLHQQLVCTTDRMPCCQNSDWNGEWYFPDDTQVGNIDEEPTSFYSSRDNRGNVYLLRLNDILFPIGNFCCRIQDAAGINQQLCVIIGELKL